jgi:glycosyltransferase involved in cell wall biosynthesis
MRDVDSRQALKGGRLHVVMILPTYLPESFGGMEQQCRKLSHALSRLGVRVTVLAPRLLSGTPRLEQDGDLSIRRFRLRRPPNLGGRHAGSLVLWSAAVMGWLWANKSMVDIIHIFHGRLHAFPGVLGGTLIGKPSLLKVGRGGEHFDLRLVRGKRLGGPLFYRILLNHASGYVANSRQIVDDLLAHEVPSDRIFVVPNGVEIPDLGSDGESGPTKGPPPREYVFTGRLDPEKRIDVMLKGFARCSDSTARLTIVGDGDCRHQLERLAADLGLWGRVAFPGRINNVSEHLRSAHFYLSTSISEGMSNALLEAMSFGVVPLVSDVSGAGDIVDHGRSGFLFQPDDLGDFVSKLELTARITAKRYRAISDAGRNSIRYHFAIDQVASHHLHIYQTLLDRTILPRSPSEGRSGAAISSCPPGHSK